MSIAFRHRSTATLAAAMFRNAGVGSNAKPPVVPKDITAAVADPARPQADRDRDAARKPAECIAFAGLKPGQHIADLIPGGGYFTRIFERRRRSEEGQVFAVAPPKRPDAPPDRPEPAAAVNAIAADPHYKNVSVSVVKIAELKLPEKLDVVWTSQNYHDLHNVKAVDLPFNKAVFDSLRPGGLYVVLDHAAENGSGLHRHVDLASERSRRREGGSDGGGLRVRRLERRHRQSGRRPQDGRLREGPARQDGPLRPQIPQTEVMKNETLVVVGLAGRLPWAILRRFLKGEKHVC